ncbi:MAG: hypothetical protein HN978_17570 [Desulfobacula sp.]|nr:hypothetical protein [Desulfobacula sp.]MBT7051463.1 hypothetical protein [Desulfobacula sp.]
MAGEKSLDHFTYQALQLVGEYIGACSLIVSIRDFKQNCGVIYARQSKQHIADNRSTLVWLKNHRMKN